MINYLHMPNSDMNPNTNDLNSKNKENDLQNFIESDPSKEIAELLRENNKYLRRYVSFKHVLLRGIATGLGGFLGATILISLLFATISRISVVPVIGDFIAQIMRFLQTNYPNQQSF